MYLRDAQDHIIQIVDLLEAEKEISYSLMDVYMSNVGNKTNDILNEPDITLFIRTNLTTGHYRYESQWPIARQRTRRMYMASGRRLTEELFPTTQATRNNIRVDVLEYRPWIGFESGMWLGGVTGDQRSLDEFCLVYQSDPINKTIEVVGFINVSLQVESESTLSFLCFSINEGQFYCSIGSLDGPI